MIKKSIWAQLPLLFGGYLHQDWDLEATSLEDAIRNFVAREPPEHVQKARDELHTLLSCDDTEAGLRHLVVAEWGCSYDPTHDGLSMREWLRHVASILGPNP